MAAAKGNHGWGLKWWDQGIHRAHMAGGRRGSCTQEKLDLELMVEEIDVS